MLRISKLTDYGTVILACLAGAPDQRLTATEVAERTRLGLPTVSKLLKNFHRAGLLTSTRGSRGGYQLARPAAAHQRRRDHRRDRRPRRDHRVQRRAQHLRRTRSPAAPATPGSASTVRSAVRSTRFRSPSSPARKHVAVWRPQLTGARPSRCPPARGPAGSEEQLRMSTSSTDLDALVAQKYQHGFVTDVESDTLPPGLDEDVVRSISKIKREPQFMLDWRLKALRHWFTMQEPDLGAREDRADRLPGHLVLLRARRPRRTVRRASRTSIRSCSPRTRSSACRCTSVPDSPAWPSMPCSTASRSRPRSRTSCPRPA